MGMRRRRSSEIQLGQISSSLNMTSRGWMRSMKRRTTKDRSSGDRITARPGYSRRARSNPAGVVTERTRRRSGFSRAASRDRRLRTSPTETAWIQTACPRGRLQLRPQPAAQQASLGWFQESGDPERPGEQKQQEVEEIEDEHISL
jgi:hypothetical protein